MVVSIIVLISLNLLNIWDFEVLNVFSVSCLYWVRKFVGYFLLSSGVLEDEILLVLFNFIKLMCILFVDEEI